jgi:SAM-dependent methyltransferase
MLGTYKSDAVWHNFKPSDFPTMALGGRRDHPSRAYFYEWLARQARQSAPTLRWCDVGVLSMVDYLNVRRSVDPDLARVLYVGLEVGAPIAQAARRHLLLSTDRIELGDLEDPQLPAKTPDRFDVISIRHVLNHCRYYQIPLRNAFDLLVPGGKLFANLHLKCSADRDHLTERPLPDVPGSYVENVYAFDKFLRYLSSLFAVEAIVELDSRLDGRNKPNQIFVGIKPGYPQRARPETITVVPSRVARWLRSVKGAMVRSRGVA